METNEQCYFSKETTDCKDILAAIGLKESVLIPQKPKEDKFVLIPYINYFLLVVTVYSVGMLLLKR